VSAARSLTTWATINTYTLCLALGVSRTHSQRTIHRLYGSVAFKPLGLSSGHSHHHHHHRHHHYYYCKYYGLRPVRFRSIWIRFLPIRTRRCNGARRRHAGRERRCRRRRCADGRTCRVPLAASRGRSPVGWATNMAAIAVLAPSSVDVAFSIEERLLLEIDRLHKQSLRRCRQAGSPPRLDHTGTDGRAAKAYGLFRWRISL